MSRNFATYIRRAIPSASDTRISYVPAPTVGIGFELVDISPSCTRVS